MELDRNVQIAFWSNWDKGMAPLKAFLDRGYQVVNYHSEYLYFILLIRKDYSDPDPDKILTHIEEIHVEIHAAAVGAQALPGAGIHLREALKVVEINELIPSRSRCWAAATPSGATGRTWRTRRKWTGAAGIPSALLAWALLSCIWVTIPSSLALADFFGIFYKIHRVNGSYYIGIPESGKVSKGRFVV